MRFCKPPISIADQVVKLRSRGLIIADEEEAVRRLASIGYYRLSGYALPFQEVSLPDKPFRKGTTWDHLIGLYVFDRELRGMIADALERIETRFRTSLNHHMCMAHGAHWYMDARHFNVRFKHNEFLARIDSELNIPEKSKKPSKVHAEVFINHYYSKYGDPYLPPCWMICEVFSLGGWSMVYENLALPSDRQAIAGNFGYDSYLFGQWIHTLSYVRNLCAHHLRLWNRALVIKSPIPRKHNAVIPAASADRLYSVVVVLFDWIRSVETQTQWHLRLEELLSRNPAVSLAAMGFPVLWRKSDFWGFVKTQP